MAIESQLESGCRSRPSDGSTDLERNAAQTRSAATRPASTICSGRFGILASTAPYLLSTASMQRV